MTIQMAERNAFPRRFWCSAGAVSSGFLAVVVLSLNAQLINAVRSKRPSQSDTLLD
jgi:hypothetical protein